MNELINNVTEEIANDIKDTNVKNIVIKEIREFTPEQVMVLETFRRISNPFKMIGVKEVSRDLKVCEKVAYKIFKREDFPAITTGKSYLVMMLPYLMWKMTRR